MAHTGEVKMWDRVRGFGFVACPDFDKEINVHFTSFGGGDLIVGAEVRFDVVNDNSGRIKATNVTGPAIDKAGPTDTEKEKAFIMKGGKGKGGGKGYYYDDGYGKGFGDEKGGKGGYKGYKGGYKGFKGDSYEMDRYGPPRGYDRDPREDRGYDRDDRGYDRYPPRDDRDRMYPPPRDYDRGYDRYPARDDRYPPRDDRYPPREERYPPREERYPPRDDRYPPRDDRYPPRDDRDYGPPRY